MRPPSHAIAALALVLACSEAKSPTSSVAPPSARSPKVDTSTVSAPGPVRHLVLAADYVSVFVGQLRIVTITGKDSLGRPAPIDGLQLELADPSGATIVGLTSWGLGGRTGTSAYTMMANVRAERPGRVRLRARAAAAVDSIDLLAFAPTALTGQLAVDSFFVAEYPVACASACPYLAYSPVAYLHERTGTGAVRIVGAEFQLNSFSTNPCDSDRTFGPGEAGPLMGVDEYPYSNDLIFISFTGRRVEADSGVLRLKVQSGNGEQTWMRIAGPVVRRASVNQLPPPTGLEGSWFCHMP